MAWPRPLAAGPGAASGATAAVGHAVSPARLLLRWLFVSAVSVPSATVAAPAGEVVASRPGGEVLAWHGTNVRDLHKEYYNIFKHGNRNAASHLWSSFLLDRSEGLTDQRLRYMFSGFCAVSGSPVQPQDRTRNRLNLELVGGGRRTGYMYYCCWPCVCDTQDYIKVDTKTVQTADGPRQYHFAVLGNPCDHPEELRRPFVQPFYGGRSTTLEREAAEVRCSPSGELSGAYLSDNGYIIINMFFDEESGLSAMDEGVFKDMCSQRAAAGYNSGMGEIFRKVAAISPINATATGVKDSCDSTVALPEKAGNGGIIE